MPTQNTNSSFSPAQLAQFFLGAGLAAILLCFGLFVWQLTQLPRSDRSAAKQRIAEVRPKATPPHEYTVEEGTGPRQSIPANLPPLLISGEEREAGDANRKEPVVDSPPRLPTALTADRDQVFEQRLRASEDDLRGELCAVPELRLLNDYEVKKTRKVEIAAQNQLDAALAEVNAARANGFADQAAIQSYQEVASRYDNAARSLSLVNRQGYNRSVLLHQAMRQAAVQAGLKLGARPSCQLDPATAAEAAKVSKELRAVSFASVAGVPFVGFKRGAVVIEGGTRLVMTSQGIFVNGPDALTAAEKAENRSKAFQSWCEDNALRRMRAAVPILTQMLQIEQEPTRLVLVHELTRSKREAATVALAIRAIADLSPTVRRAALAGLKQRPSSEYLPILLRGLRYPWPPLADHAAVALRTLKPPEAAASLVELLDLPSPSAPVYDANTKHYRVREVVRLNHLRNCLLCHAPSANKYDGLVRGLVPTLGQPLKNTYYESEEGNFVRADITFLRQDFSINLPEEDAAPWPDEQRFDFVTRLRTATPYEVAQLPALTASYPQRDAVLYALRGLTGKDGGDSSEKWRDLLGLADQATEEKNDAPLDKTHTPPKD